MQFQLVHTGRIKHCACYYMHHASYNVHAVVLIDVKVFAPHLMWFQTVSEPLIYAFSCLYVCMSHHSSASVPIFKCCI